MLQKIIMVLVSVFTMIASSIAPASLLGDGDGGGSALGRVDASSTVETRFATRGYAAGVTFAKLSVISVAVDGREVLEDSWGQGAIRELTFKVGVKRAEGNSVLMGDDAVPLKPLDTITIRDFHGRFEFRGLRSSEATIALDGTVKTTTVAKGELLTKVQTQVLSPDPSSSLGAPARVDLAYVVLETGESVKTVTHESANAGRLYTWSPEKQDAEGEAASVLAKWIKIDGKPVTQYTWGDGRVGKIEFLPTDRATLGALLNWSGEEHALRPGESVILDGFVGTYLAFQALGGGMKLRLDGYAEKMAIGKPETPRGTPGNNQPPVARIGFSPENPTTQDYVSFTDLSEDPDGLVVFREWKFFDTNQSTIVPNPRHKFGTPGTWVVELKVTDNGLANHTTFVSIPIGNTPPVSDWDFDPKDVFTGDVVRFTDKSWDPDNPEGPVEREWDFGDSSPFAEGEVVTHPYTTPGNYTATLEVVDSNGATNRLSKVISVKNRLPIASFDFTPFTPLSQVDVQFRDLSTDRDGAITCWDWSFGDGGRSTLQNPVHRFQNPGSYLANLTVCDDDGGRSTAQSTITIENRAPLSDFRFSPLVGITTSTEVQFTDLSSDLDGRVTGWRWNFGDGSPPDTRQHPRHRFFSSEVFNVCLTTRDNRGAEATTCKPLPVDNSAPIVSFDYSPSAAGAPVSNQSVAFTDRTTDPDGDALVNWTWAFGDFSAPAFERSPVHRFAQRGTYLVSLTVTDSGGRTGTGAKTVTVYNDRPTATFNWTPVEPRTRDDVVFTAIAQDSDGIVVTYAWDFADGSPVVSGASPLATHRFPQAGTYPVKLTVTDDAGGNRTVARDVVVRPTQPEVDFTFAPSVPDPNEPVSFTDSTQTFGATIVERRWSFGDGATDSQQNPIHAFAAPGTYTVRFTIKDANNTEYTKTKPVRVNDPPRASFTATKLAPALGETITFTDTSFDSDGTIDAWSWDFGDGSPAVSGKGPHQHAFGTPGSFTVTLTVTDNDLATGVATRIVSVANRAPVADFTFSPASPQRGTPVQFTDASADPDAPNDQVETWLWNFGALQSTSTAQNPQEVFASSGVKTVRLKVTDGQAESTKEKRLRVVSDHDLTIRVCGRLPDGRLLSFANPIAGAFVNHSKPVGFGPGTPTLYGKSSQGAAIDGEGCALIPIPAVEWAIGDSIAVRVGVHGVGNSETHTLAPTDSDTVINVELKVSLPLDPTIRALNGTRDPLLSDVVDLRVPGVMHDFARYVDQTERVRVAGHVDWRDGVDAAGADVRVFVRYIGLRLLQGLPEATNNPVTGWCAAAVDMNGNTAIKTDDSGNFAAQLFFEPHCLDIMGEEGVMLPGWYQVRALADFDEPVGNPATIPGTSAPSLFYEDPLGAVTGRVGFPAPP